MAATTSQRYSPSLSSSPSRMSTYSDNSEMSSAASTLQNIISGQPAILSLEEERRRFSCELGVLEPRPIVYWDSVESRMEDASKMQGRKPQPTRR